MSTQDENSLIDAIHRIGPRATRELLQADDPHDLAADRLDKATDDEDKAAANKKADSKAWKYIEHLVDSSTDNGWRDTLQEALEDYALAEAIDLEPIPAHIWHRASEAAGSDTALAEQLEVTRMTIWRWKNGKSACSGIRAKGMRYPLRDLLT